MSGETAGDGDGNGPTEAELRAIVRDELESQDTLGQSGDAGLSEADIREIAREEGKAKWTRGGVLAALGGAAGAAATGTAGAAAGSATNGSLDVASVTANTYRIASDFYGGPESARTELNSELGSGDAGAKYLGVVSSTNLHLYHWNGSGWDDLGNFSSNNPTVDSLTVNGSLQTGSETIGGGPTVTRSHGLSHITTLSVSGGEIEATSIDSTYDNYVIDVSGLQSDTDPDNLFVRVSTDGGSTYQSGSSDYNDAGHNVASNASENIGGANGAGTINLTKPNKMGAASGEHFNGVVEIIAPQDTSLHTFIHCRRVYVDGGGNLEVGQVGGQFTETTAVDAVKLFTNNNIASASAELYGRVVA